MKRVWLSLLIVLACLLARPVFATACSNPATIGEGDIIYNNDFHTYQFCNGTNWVSMGGIGTGGPITFISTQTASSSASLQFTNLPTIYNTLFLNCSGLLMSANGYKISVYIGEGAGPTWETTAHYNAAGTYSSSSTAVGTFEPGAGAADVTDGQVSPLLAAHPVKLSLYIDNVGSSTLYKNILWETAYRDSGSAYYWSIRGASFWFSDTNANSSPALARFRQGHAASTG
jgi:hypothetical protein